MIEVRPQWPTRRVGDRLVRVFCPRGRTVDDPNHRVDAELFALWGDYVCICGLRIDEGRPNVRDAF